MSLRNKLLLAFISLIVVSISIFAFSAYQAAYHSAHEKDHELLESLISSGNNNLYEEYLLHNNLQELNVELARQSSETQAWFLLDSNNNVIQNDVNSSFLPDVLPHMDFKIIFEEDLRSGEVLIQNQPYLWVYTDFGATPYKLFYIFKPGINIRQYFNNLSSRLIIIGLIIVWVAVWIALVISTLITRTIQAQQEALEHQANYDMLTNLPNRGYINKKIDSLIKQADVRHMAVVMMGMDRFREINDTLGHDFGDTLLMEVGERLTEEFWENDIVGRLGGDQFAVVLPISEKIHATVVIDKIQNLLAHPFKVKDINHYMNMSIGISVYPDNGNDANSLIKSAEVAMYNAKARGSVFEFYRSENDPHSVERLLMIGDLSNAIEKQEFFLNYQPKIDISSKKIIGVEALLRWNNEVRGMVPPDVFIPLAEQSNIISDITYWVMEHAIAQCSEWQNKYSDITIAINISSHLFINKDIVPQIKVLLEQYKLAAESLTLELTETAIMLDPMRAIQTMKLINEIGVKLSIDDFGTGYTSISQLKNLPVSEIKIDKSFVMQMLEDIGDEQIVKSIIELSEIMGFQSVAEGIESEAILIRLQELGCDIAQGYHLARPMSSEQLEDYLTNYSS
ncbi:MAG: putative bifunctional diguanylate cyclase/phosphodiesterase [Gammaproteobacteria bacterium]